MHLFSWYFIKGEKICIFILQLVFCLPLISTPTLYIENWFYFDIICSKWQILTIGIFLYQDAYLNTLNWYQDFICFLKIGINALFTFKLYMFTFIWYLNVLLSHIFNWHQIYFIEKIRNVLISNMKNILIYDCLYARGA